MEYQYLDADQQKAMLEARLRQLEAEHYGHAMNAKNAKSDEEAAAAEEAMATIDAAYGAAQIELAAIEKKGKKSA